MQFKVLSLCIMLQVKQIRNFLLSNNFLFLKIWRMLLGLVNAVVLCFLVLAVFKIAATLETIDKRLHNIERVLMPRS